MYMLPNLETKGQFRLATQTWITSAQESINQIKPSQGVGGYSESYVFGEARRCKGSKKCFHGA